ncbi:DNA replication and repair protein RecO [Planctomicrobium piriforme]|uniref:DNA repair protein RecO n=2 Tax=Planctomicrobium piriforme TaxID=1576369 RepID=A0A1I3TBG7_9PLAN|nr:DNA replication and repair protein RecO [Planctomicrobium piriforme]
MTLFTRDFGKVSALAKGAKRLKSAFESGFDLLARCRVVFLHKSTTALDLLTESQLLERFHPRAGSLSHLYGGYYVAELLNALTEEDDPHPLLYDAAVAGLEHLGRDESPFLAVTRFELAVLFEIGQLPDFYSCTICHSDIAPGHPGRFWVSQSGLICSNCGRSEYQPSEFHPGSLAVLHQLLQTEAGEPGEIPVSAQQKKEIRRLMTAAISHVLGRRPKTLSLITM